MMGSPGSKIAGSPLSPGKLAFVKNGFVLAKLAETPPATSVVLNERYGNPKKHSSIKPSGKGCAHESNYLLPLLLVYFGQEHKYLDMT